MLDIDKHARTAQKKSQMRFWAIENAYYDRACELEAYLRKYLAEKSLKIEVSRALNTLTLSNPKGHRLLISTQDHRTYKVRSMCKMRGTSYAKRISRVSQKIA